MNMAMTYKKTISWIFTLVFISTISLPASANIDCDGKSFHCVNSTHFMICVDFGGGVSSTLGNFLIPCPLTTECRKTNRFECELPKTSTVAPIEVSVSSGVELIETTTVPFHGAAKFLQTTEAFSVVPIITTDATAGFNVTNTSKVAPELIQSVEPTEMVGSHKYVDVVTVSTIQNTMTEKPLVTNLNYTENITANNATNLTATEVFIETSTDFPINLNYSKTTSYNNTSVPNNTANSLLINVHPLPVNSTAFVETSNNISTVENTNSTKNSSRVNINSETGIILNSTLIAESSTVPTEIYSFTNISELPILTKTVPVQVSVPSDIELIETTTAPLHGTVILLQNTEAFGVDPLITTDTPNGLSVIDTSEKTPQLIQSVESAGIVGSRNDMGIETVSTIQNTFNIQNTEDFNANNTPNLTATENPLNIEKFFENNSNKTNISHMASVTEFTMINNFTEGINETTKTRPPSNLTEANTELVTETSTDFPINLNYSMIASNNNTTVPNNKANSLLINDRSLAANSRAEVEISSNITTVEHTSIIKNLSRVDMSQVTLHLNQTVEPAGIVGLFKDMGLVTASTIQNTVSEKPLDLNYTESINSNNLTATEKALHIEKFNNTNLSHIEPVTEMTKIINETVNIRPPYNLTKENTEHFNENSTDFPIKFNNSKIASNNDTNDVANSLFINVHPLLVNSTVDVANISNIAALEHKSIMNNLSSEAGITLSSVLITESSTVPNQTRSFANNKIYYESESNNNITDETFTAIQNNVSTVSVIENNRTLHNKPSNGVNKQINIIPMTEMYDMLNTTTTVNLNIITDVTLSYNQYTDSLINDYSTTMEVSKGANIRSSNTSVNSIITEYLANEFTTETYSTVTIPESTTFNYIPNEYNEYNQSTNIENKKPINNGFETVVETPPRIASNVKTNQSSDVNNQISSSFKRELDGPIATTLVTVPEFLQHNNDVIIEKKDPNAFDLQPTPNTFLTPETKETMNKTNGFTTETYLTIENTTLNWNGNYTNISLETPPRIATNVKTNQSSDIDNRRSSSFNRELSGPIAKTLMSVQEIAQHNNHVVIEKKDPNAFDLQPTPTIVITPETKETKNIKTNDFTTEPYLQGTEMFGMEVTTYPTTIIQTSLQDSISTFENITESYNILVNANNGHIERTVSVNSVNLDNFNVTTALNSTVKAISKNETSVNTEYNSNIDLSTRSNVPSEVVTEYVPYKSAVEDLHKTLKELNKTESNNSSTQNENSSAVITINSQLNLIQNVSNTPSVSLFANNFSLPTSKNIIKSGLQRVNGIEKNATNKPLTQMDTFVTSFTSINETTKRRTMPLPVTDLPLDVQVNITRPYIILDQKLMHNININNMPESVSTNLTRNFTKTFHKNLQQLNNTSETVTNTSIRQKNETFKILNFNSLNSSTNTSTSPKVNFADKINTDKSKSSDNVLISITAPLPTYVTKGTAQNTVKISAPSLFENVNTLANKTTEDEKYKQNFGTVNILKTSILFINETSEVTQKKDLGMSLSINNTKTTNMTLATRQDNLRRDNHTMLNNILNFNTSTNKQVDGNFKIIDSSHNQTKNIHSYIHNNTTENNNSFKDIASIKNVQFKHTLHILNAPLSGNINNSLTPQIKNEVTNITITQQNSSVNVIKKPDILNTEYRILNNENTSKTLPQAKETHLPGTNNTHYNHIENKTKQSEFNCLNRKRGRYSDKNDCSKYYICIGRVEPVIGKCPDNTVFSDNIKQCTKNIAHCNNEREFKCTSRGRFSDISNARTYYICVSNGNTFVRFKFQCQNGYHLDKKSVKCIEDLNSDSHNQSSLSIDDNNSERSRSEETIYKSHENKDSIFKCEKEGKFEDVNDCRKYYVCTKNKQSQFRRRMKKCDTDEVFHKVEKKCVDDDSYDCD